MNPKDLMFAEAHLVKDRGSRAMISDERLIMLVGEAFRYEVGGGISPRNFSSFVGDAALPVWGRVARGLAGVMQGFIDKLRDLSPVTPRDVATFLSEMDEPQPALWPMLQAFHSRIEPGIIRHRGSADYHPLAQYLRSQTELVAPHLLPVVHARFATVMGVDAGTPASVAPARLAPQSQPGLDLEEIQPLVTPVLSSGLRKPSYRTDDIFGAVPSTPVATMPQTDAPRFALARQDPIASSPDINANHPPVSGSSSVNMVNASLQGQPNDTGFGIESGDPGWGVAELQNREASEGDRDDSSLQDMEPFEPLTQEAPATAVNAVVRDTEMDRKATPAGRIAGVEKTRQRHYAEAVMARIGPSGMNVHDLVAAGLKIGRGRHDLDGKPDMDIVCILPPPPAKDLHKSHHMLWIKGHAWHDMALGMSFTTVDPDEMMDLETEIHGRTSEVLARKGVAPSQDPGADTAGEDWLARAGRDLGVTTTSDAARVAFLASFERITEAHQPQTYRNMVRIGASLLIPDALAEALAATTDIERFWIGDGIEGEPQNVQGAISGSKALMPGIVFDRAIACHMNQGLPLGQSLRNALVELRLAQAENIIGIDAMQSLTFCENIIYNAYDADLDVFEIHHPEMAM